MTASNTVETTIERPNSYDAELRRINQDLADQNAAYLIVERERIAFSEALDRIRTARQAKTALPSHTKTLTALEAEAAETNARLEAERERQSEIVHQGNALKADLATAQKRYGRCGELVQFFKSEMENTDSATVDLFLAQEPPMGQLLTWFANSSAADRAIKAFGVAAEKYKGEVQDLSRQLDAFRKEHGFKG